MRKTSKYLLGGALFILCALIGFFVTKAFTDNSGDKDNQEIKMPKQESEEGNSSSNISSSPSSPESGINESDESEQNSPAPINNESLESVEIEATSVQKIGDSYSLHVRCKNIPDNVILKYEIPELGQQNSDGFFTLLPGCKSGSYTVNVKNSSTGRILASKVVYGFKEVKEEPVKLMTKEEFQAILLNQSDNSLLGGKNPKVARNISLSFEGMQEGDIKPTDILAVRQKIAFDQWKSAKVKRVGYDGNGRINSAVIEPVY